MELHCRTPQDYYVHTYQRCNFLFKIPLPSCSLAEGDAVGLLVVCLQCPLPMDTHKRAFIIIRVFVLYLLAGLSVLFMHTHRPIQINQAPRAAWILYTQHQCQWLMQRNTEAVSFARVVTFSVFVPFNHCTSLVFVRELVCYCGEETDPKKAWAVC